MDRNRDFLQLILHALLIANQCERQTEEQRSAEEPEQASIGEGPPAAVALNHEGNYGGPQSLADGVQGALETDGGPSGLGAVAV